MPTFGVRVYKEYFNFASSHFLIFADGTREELHGHNYQVRVKVLGEVGEGDMVLDFCRLKPIVKRYCDELDHRTLLPANNPRLSIEEVEGHWEARFTTREETIERFVLPRRDALVLPITNTSTERLAEYLAGKILVAVREEGQNSRLTSFTIEVEEAGGQCGLYEVELE
jgi:6-pyruvoyltetrahydropterin/6-carboxytetrahydropterin synthase